MAKSGHSDTTPDVRWTLLDLDGLPKTRTGTSSRRRCGPTASTRNGTDRRTRGCPIEGFVGWSTRSREYHGRTFGTFWNDDLGLESGGYDWQIGHEPTVDALERYLDRQAQRLSWSDSTVEAHAYRLGRYVRAYENVNDTGDLLTPVAGQRRPASRGRRRLLGHLRRARSGRRPANAPTDLQDHVELVHDAGQSPRGGAEPDRRPRL